MNRSSNFIEGRQLGSGKLFLPALEGTTPDRSVRFFVFMSSVTLRSPWVTVSPWSGAMTDCQLRVTLARVRT